MSIPKEPRQLMINLMYLVLTAMLALNVSAEIINAFFMVDKGITKSNKIVGTANENIISAIQTQVKAYPEYEKWETKADQAHVIVEDFYGYVQGIRDEIVMAAGGLDTLTRKPKNYKDKDVTTNILVDGPKLDNTGKGHELEKKITETRNALLALIDDPIERENLAKGLALELDEAYKDSKKKSWADYNFGHMPVAAVLPMFSKFQNDAKTSETALLTYFAKEAKGTKMTFDSFEPVVSAKKGYIIKGEKYEAEVFLSASSTKSSGSTTITAGGKGLSVKDGKGLYSVTTSSTGTKKYNVSISVTNPLTKIKETFNKEFEYEVGERSVTVSADKMNVFYIGVDNPVSVVAAGISSNDLSVNGSGSGITLTPAGRGKYIAKAKNPGNATITVSGGGLASTKFEFRVKRIPDPIARLGREDSGALGTGAFKAQGGVGAWLDNFDFKATCKIEGFVMTRVAKRQDPVDAPNRGARFGAQAARLVKMATPGDIYYFENIKARCPGDPAARKINSLVFKIK
jgi:gliding motility-associated protein GldM